MLARCHRIEVATVVCPRYIKSGEMQQAVGDWTAGTPLTESGLCVSPDLFPCSDQQQACYYPWPPQIQAGVITTTLATRIGRIGPATFLGGA